MSALRVLFITSNRLGDAVLSTGLLGALIDAEPCARLTIACGPLPAPLFRAVPGLDQVIPLPKQRFARHWIDLWRACVGSHWDAVVDLRNSAISRLLRARRRIVWKRAQQGLHKVEEMGRLIDLVPPPAPRLWLDAKARDEASRLLPDNSCPLLAIGPTANWRSKEWPAERFSKLARRLTDQDGPLPHGRVVVLAAGSESERARPVVEALADRAIDLTGRTDPMSAAACLERAALFVGNDSGLMHIAASVGTPTLGLFGPGYPETYGPWGAHCRTVTSMVPRTELEERLRQDPDAMGQIGRAHV